MTEPGEASAVVVVGVQSKPAGGASGDEADAGGDDGCEVFTESGERRSRIVEEVGKGVHELVAGHRYHLRGGRVVRQPGLATPAGIEIEPRVSTVGVHTEDAEHEVGGTPF